LVAVVGGTWFAVRPVQTPTADITTPREKVFQAQVNPPIPHPIEKPPVTESPTRLETAPVIPPTPITPRPVTPPADTPPVITQTPVAHTPDPSSQGTPTITALSKPPDANTLALATPPAETQPPPRPKISPAAVSAALQAVPCSFIGGEVVPPGDSATLNGLVGKGPAEDAARKAVATAAPGAKIDWHVSTFDGPYCRVLDLLRGQGPRFGVASPGFSFKLAGDHPGANDTRVKLYDGDMITLNFTMPNFASYLLVDDFDQDQNVSHLHPTADDGPRLYAAGSRKSLNNGQVGTPYGTDLLVAIASSLQLATPRRAVTENENAYLSELQKAIDSVLKRGGHVAVDAMILDTASR
jgi:serine/threonine-protein kinase